MSRYGLPSRKMLTFLNENPGSTARQIHDHLHGGGTVEQLKVSYSNKWGETFTYWQPKSYVLNCMLNREYYHNIQILDERVHPVSKVCRGKFSYLTSPYNCRTLASDSSGARPHPASANKSGQRRWWWRMKHNGVYKYFLTTNGMAEVELHGLV